MTFYVFIGNKTNWIFLWVVVWFRKHIGIFQLVENHILNFYEKKTSQGLA